jgi:N-acetylneuraminic acid mutarotase
VTASALNEEMILPMEVSGFHFASTTLLAVCIFALLQEASSFTTHLDAAAGSKFSWAWSRVDAGGLQPSAREGHAAVEVGNKIFVLGGCVQGIRCFNDVHIFDTDELTWSQEAFTGDAPEPRGGHSATLVGTDIFVFGGASSETTYGDAYKLDLIQRHWTRAVPSDCPAVPSRRTNHAAIADAHGRIYIMGGYDADSNFLNDMWILNVYAGNVDRWEDGSSFPVVWEKPAPTGQLPTAREGHSLTLVDRKLILFGGYTSAGAVANDVHLYNLDSQEWVTPLVAGEMLPAPRQAHSAARHGRDVIVAGGCSVSDVRPECYNDVWSLNTIDMRWTKRSSDVVSWFAREGHSAIFVRGRMFAFGGCQLTSECFNDVAVLDTSDPCPSSCSGHGTCAMGQFCRCAAGFTGHDCMQPLTCPKDCSGHGQCNSDGTCACDNGWGGSACTIDIPCPGAPSKCTGHGKCLDSGQCQCFAGFSSSDCALGSPVCPRGCSGRGYCSATSQCVCNPGFTGVDCSTPFVGIQDSAHVPSQKASSRSGQQPKVLSLAVSKTNVSQAYVPPHKKHQVPAPTGAQFGIPDVNDVGHTGVQVGKCDDNCNFRGVCQDGECFCQPGFYGKKCGMVKTSEKGTVSLAVLLLIGGGCAVVSFSIMTLLLHLSMQSKRAKETELGYNI